jgi:hypothetical protein
LTAEHAGAAGAVFMRDRPRVLGVVDLHGLTNEKSLPGSQRPSGIGGTIVFSCSGRFSVIVATGPSVAYRSVSKLAFAGI